MTRIPTTITTRAAPPRPVGAAAIEHRARRALAWAGLLPGAAPLLLAGCAQVLGFEEFGAGAGGAGGTAGTGGGGGAGGSAGAGCPAATDPGLHGPAMARVRRPDGTCFWIDATEVTVGDYQQFLSTSAPTQDGVCAWNGSDAGTPPAGATPGLAPNGDCVAASPTPDGGAPDHPITCVDWCDARAFCGWAGKDLCRDEGLTSDPAESDFVQACTEGSPANLYGCGCSATGICNRSGTLLPVGSSTGCAVAGEGGSAAVSDLSGNAAEWTRWCTPDTASGECLTRGGSYASSSDSQLQCNTAVRLARTLTNPTVGFRCCAE